MAIAGEEEEEVEKEEEQRAGADSVGNLLFAVKKNFFPVQIRCCENESISSCLSFNRKLPSLSLSLCWHHMSCLYSSELDYNWLVH